MDFVWGMFSPGWVTHRLTAKPIKCSVPEFVVSKSGQELLTVLILVFSLKGETSVHGTAASPKEGHEEGSENDHGVPSSKKIQGERGGGAALKENVCQVVFLKKSI